MKILLAGINEKSYQYKRLKEEGEKRNHRVDRCFERDLIVDFDEKGEVEFLINGNKLFEYDVVYSFRDEYCAEWISALKYLIEKKELKVINSKVIHNSLNYSQIKAYIEQSNEEIVFPRSVICLFGADINKIVKDYNFEFPFVLKSGNSRQGDRVFKIDSIDELNEVVMKLGSQDRTLILRDFIENKGDFRILTIGYKAVAGIKRVSKKDEFLNNISKGASAEKVEEKEFERLAMIAEKISIKLGIEIAGVDIMIGERDGKDYVLEVNVGPQITMTEKVNEMNIAGLIIEYMEGRYEKN